MLEQPVRRLVFILIRSQFNHTVHNFVSSFVKAFCSMCFVCFKVFSLFYLTLPIISTLSLSIISRPIRIKKSIFDGRMALCVWCCSYTWVCVSVCVYGTKGVDVFRFESNCKCTICKCYSQVYPSVIGTALGYKRWPNCWCSDLNQISIISWKYPCDVHHIDCFNKFPKHLILYGNKS